MLCAYYAPSEVRFTGAQASAVYQWGEKSIRFHHCPVCFCLTHWSPVDPKGVRMGVNARLMAPSVVKAAKVRKLDGADTLDVLP